MRYPFDLVAHQAVTLLDGYLGRFRWVRDRTARALPFWSKDQPGYASILAFHGFGLEEAGDYSRAEDESRAAAELEPHSFWPHHTVAHVMEMTGRPEDGLGWMVAREPFWSAPENVTQVHIWWHKSLFHLELGQYEAALALYDGPLLNTLRPLALNLCNASALLWRLDTLGYDVSQRWRDLVARWEGHADGKSLMFNDLHAAMAELGSGQEALAERRLGWMRETASSSAESASCYREVGIPLVEGMMAFHRGAYGQAVDLLQPVRIDLWRIGGSNAQRDVVDWTLTEAAVRGGLRDVALSLANERLGMRPRSAVNRNSISAPNRSPRDDDPAGENLALAQQRRSKAMPEVYVHAIEGRSKDQKRALIKDITDAVVKNFGVTADAVLVEIVETSRDNKAKGGVLFSER